MSAHALPKPRGADVRRARGYLFFFIVSFLVIAALVGGTSFFVYRGQFREFRAMVLTRQRSDLQNQEQLISQRFRDIIADVVFLSRTECLRAGIESGDFTDAVELFLSFAGAKGHYAQLRFLDAGGIERVRVDTLAGVSRPVPERQLQDKSSRYYFRDSIFLDEGEVYVSPLDLNIENGIIEDPPNPMIRFASPVVADGETRGVIVINYAASRFLEEIRVLGNRGPGDFFMLNDEGYYFITPDRSMEWGFMHPDRRHQRFGVSFPEFWSIASIRNEAALEYGSGLISSLTIHPMNGLSMDIPDYRWIAVKRIDGSDLREDFRSIRGRLAFLGAFLILLSALPAWAVSVLLARRARQRHELFLSANYDALTGLPNRQLGMDRLGQMLLRCRRYGSTGAVYFLDLDGFKTVNDVHGHDAGDELLKQVAARLTENLRETDTAARFGGDEFILVTPFGNSRGAPERLAGKILDILSRPYALSIAEAAIGVSIGIRMVSGASGESPEDIIREADEAMYEAKNAGKGRYALFSDASDS